ncbi:MAG: hypothetical protein KJ556_21120 [Gammaproteobacteria bacterium]|nr:hypothetical protein [Gammaproteobacteria bacterium]
MIGVLGTINNPITPLYMAALSLAWIPHIGILDPKLETEKDLAIFKDRTGGRFERGKFGMPDIYYVGETFYVVPSHNDWRVKALARKHHLTALLNAGTPRRLIKEIIECVPSGVISVHPGLLPKYRGCCAVEWSLYNGDPVGNTAFFMAEGYDTGPIITKEFYELPPDAEYTEIRTHVIREGAKLAAKACQAVLNTGMGPKDGIVQDEAEARYWGVIPEEYLKTVKARYNGGDHHDKS